MSKDYYKVLGVDKSASADEIKKAFRKLAHEHHPDKQSGDEAKFKEINEAYQILGNTEKRQKYDQFGSDFENQGGFGGGAGWEDFMRAARGQGGAQGGQFDFGGMDLGDLFGGAFNFGGSRSGGSRRTRGNDVQVDMKLSFREAVFGVEKEIRLHKLNNCEVCSGSGTEPGSSLKTCDECKGQGQVRRMQQTIIGAMQTVATCGTCSGRGQVPEKRCKHCTGTGRIKSDSKYMVKIPAGIDTGGTIRLTGYGESGGAGGTSGDLYVVTHVETDKIFTREGDHIYTDLTISYPQAVLGDTVEIETLDGKKKIVIPEGVQSHEQIRLKQLGVPHLQASGRGDQFVRVIVHTPKKVSKHAKQLLQDLKKELS